ncbi:MAG TPA: DUF1684 domain-containing protein [Saprospiraceae bacterium]|nr:DUF1684 domain-containing protein [Saprospiraceae bacterium]
MKIRQSLIVTVTVICAIHFMGCEAESRVHREEYIHEIEQWRIDRLQRLRGPRSWLSLIGRYPLQGGANSVGTRDTHDVRLPGAHAMDIGFVFVDSHGLSMQPAPDVMILLDDGSLFNGGPIDMSSPPFLHMDALYWTFLERAGKYYFRLWDTLSPARNALHEIPAYPIDPEWIIDVTFTPADPGAMIVLDDIQGEKRINTLMGSITGARNDTSFTLLALEGGEDELFIIIEDATTDIETYPGGRYLDIPTPDSTGHTQIDFNKAYIPPCAFTEFATCLLPPKENRLPFAVRAGEKDHKHE